MAQYHHSCVESIFKLQSTNLVRYIKILIENCQFYLLLLFLPREAILRAVYAVVVCLCVCLCVCACVSVTLRYCIKTAKRRIMQITPHDSLLTLVFSHQSSRRNSKVSPPTGATNAGGVG